MNGQLYKRSFGGPLLKCVLPEQAEEVMTEVHEGICSAHQGANTLSRKIILQGYYWPSLVEDCIKKVKACPVCQPFARKETRPAMYYMPVGSAISFAKWGIDILRPLPMVTGQVKFCIVAWITLPSGQPRWQRSRSNSVGTSCGSRLSVGSASLST